MNYEGNIKATFFKMKVCARAVVHWQSKGPLQQTEDFIWMRDGQMENDLRDD